MGSTSINSSINSHVPFYSSVNSYSSDNLNENSNYTNSSQNNQQNASPASNEDSLLTNSDLAPYKPIFNYELAFTNYSKPNSCSLLELSETNETKLETYSNSIDIDISITTSTAPGSPGTIVDNSIQDNNIYSSTLIDTVQNENQSPNDNANSQSSIPSEQLVNGHSFIPMEKVELQQPSDLNTIQEESNEKESSLYSIDSIDLTVEEETDIIVDPSIFKPKVKDSLDQSPDQDSKSSDSDSSSPSKKVTKKRKKPRKNYFAPPKKSKPKAKKAEEEEENMLNLALTDELDFITKENTEKNIISLREKNYVTVIKKASEKPNEELDNNMGGEDNRDEFDSDYDDDTPRQRSKKSRKITWNTTPQYKEFHKNQSITLGERFCSPVKSKAEKPKKSCISRKAPFNSPNTKRPKKSRPLSPVTVTRIIYSKK